MRYILIGLALLPSLFLFGQKYDGIWMLGHSNGQGGNPSKSNGISILDFRYGDSLNIYPDYNLKLGFDAANISICDRSGNYLFSSNGVRVYNKADAWMEGGENLNVNENHGYILPQGVLSLPHPRDTNLYAFFHGRKGVTPRMEWTFYSEIDMQENEGLGAVTSMEDLIQDTLLYGQITAVQHGNGKDWWILFQRYCFQRSGCEYNFFYKVLLTSDGVEISEQEIKDTLLTDTGLGQAIFTPNGTKYIASQGDQFYEPSYIDIYDFDRCTGELSNRKRIETVINDYGEENGAGSGLVASSNSRFLYFITWNKIFQYDLWQEDIQVMQDSRALVAEYDGFVQYTRDSFPLATRFLRGQLAPDGKIYISATNGVQYLHVIHNPDVKGLNCKVEQHGIYLPTYNGFSIPNHPNYRLGKWEGSPCDTLSPISSTEEITASKMKFFPNPSSGFLQLELDENVPISQLEVRFYSLTGQLMQSFRAKTTFNLSDWSSGVYIASVLRNGQIVGRKKVVIQK